MLKKALCASAVIALSLCLFGCGGEAENAEKPPVSDEVVLVDSGWSADSFSSANGEVNYDFINYALVLENRSDKTAVNPTYKIIGKDADGKVVLSDELNLTDEIQPGETLGWAGDAPCDVPLETVEFEVVDADFVRHGENPAVTYEVGDPIAVEVDGQTYFVSAVVNTSENAASRMSANVVLYKDGEIVGGYHEVFDGVGSHRSESIEVMSVSDEIPEYDEAKIFVSSTD